MPPMPKEAHTAKSANAAPMTAPRGPKAWRMTYMGPPRQLSPGIFLPKAHRQQTLGICERHARQSRQLHPYQSTRPARGERGGHPHDCSPCRSVAARAVISEANGESAPGLDAFRASRPGRRQGHSPGSPRQKPQPDQKDTPVPSTSSNVPGPQKNTSSRARISSSVTAAAPFLVHSLCAPSAPA